MDFTRRLLDHGLHISPPHFLPRVPECLLIEPPETCAQAGLGVSAPALARLMPPREELERSRSAPHTMPVRRTAEVRAAQALDLR